MSWTLTPLTALMLAVSLAGCAGDEPAEAPAQEAPATRGEAPAPPADDPIAAVLSKPVEPDAAIGERSEEDKEKDKGGEADPLPVYLDLEVEFPEDDGRPKIAGRTNLPDRTMLVISVQGDEASGYATQDIASVGDGRFSAGPFGPGDGLASGEYTARVSMALPRSQPESVQALIGVEGELLVGEHVEQTDLGISVALEEPFTVVAGAGRLLGGEEAREEARAIVEGLTAAEELGRAMEALRTAGSGDCQLKQAEGTQQLTALAGRSARLPRALQSPLDAAMNDLKHCIQCEGTALEMCTIAKLSIQRASAQITSATTIDLTPAPEEN
jgi:hypothetical protein